MVVFLCQRVVVIIVYAQVVGCGIGLLPSFGQALASCLASFLACGSVLLLVVLELQPPSLKMMAMYHGDGEIDTFLDHI